MSKVRIGFIGSGSMGQLAHIANYAFLPDVEMASLAEGRTKTAEAVGRKYGINKLYADHKEMLAKEKLDGVVTIMSYGQHYHVAPDVLEAGMNVLTEKPLCISPENGRKLVQKAQEKKVIYHVGYMKRCDPASVYVKEKIAEWKKNGEFGRFNYLRVAMPPGDWTFGVEPPAIDMGEKKAYADQGWESSPSWMDKETSDRYGAFVNYYIHQVNLIRYLLGEDYKVDYAEKSGKVMACVSDSGLPITLEMGTYTLRDEWHEFYDAFFDRGYIKLSLPAPLAKQRTGLIEIYTNRDSGAVYERPVLPPRWSMTEQARMFVEELQGKRECISPASEALKDLEIAESYIKLLTGKK